MSLKTRLGAFLLALLLAALPLAALAKCLPSASAKAHCPDDCPMMQGNAAGHKLQAVAPGGDCCQISSDKRPQSSPAQLPTAGSAKAAPPAAPQILAAAPASVPAHAVAAPVRSSCGAAHQALLCTFLI